MRGNIHQLKRKIIRVIIFSSINLLNIKKEGFSPLSLDRLSIIFYFSFLADLKKTVIFLARAREGTCKNIFKNWCFTQGIQKESWWCESNSYFRSPINFQIWDFCKCRVHLFLIYLFYNSWKNLKLSINIYQRILLLLLLSFCIFTSSNSFLETILILYAGYLVFHHLLIEIATPSKFWLQILTHRILVSTSL